LQIAVAREQQRSPGSVVVGVGVPDHAVFGPELSMENCVGTAPDEQGARHCDREAPKHGGREQCSRLIGRRWRGLGRCKCHDLCDES